MYQILSNNFWSRPRIRVKTEGQTTEVWDSINCFSFTFFTFNLPSFNRDLEYRMRSKKDKLALIKTMKICTHQYAQKISFNKRFFNQERHFLWDTLYMRGSFSSCFPSPAWLPVETEVLFPTVTGIPEIAR